MDHDLTMDDSKFQRRLDELHAALVGAGKDGDAATIIEDEARKFLQTVINVTPPRSQAQGEAAVQSDVKAIFFPARFEFLDHIQHAFGDGVVRQWLTNANDEKYLLDWQNVKISPNGEGMSEYHELQRNPETGRVLKHGDKENRAQGLWMARDAMAVSYDAFKFFLLKEKSRVGMEKSGWAPAYEAVGGKLPEWIERHEGRNLGGVENNLNRVGSPMIRVFNHAPGITAQFRILRAAFKTRRSAIEKRIRLIVSGYAKDIAAGIQVGKKARQTGTI